MMNRTAASNASFAVYLTTTAAAFALSFFLLLVAVAAAATGTYDGAYDLTAAFDENGASIDVPRKERPFTLQLSSKKDSSNDDEVEEAYDMTVRIGNTLGGTLEIMKSDPRVRVGPMRSTMMMPPPDVWELERHVTAMLPATTEIRLEKDDDNNEILTLSGAKGSLVFEREE